MQNHMKLAWRRALPGALGIIVGIMMTYAVSVAPASGQAAAPAAPAAQKPQMSEDVFKNIQVLKGVPVDEFMDIMGFFAASLTLNCTECHGEESGGRLGESNGERPAVEADCAQDDSDGERDQ